MPLKEGLGTLILIDEVLLYAKVKMPLRPGWLDILISFFQYLTQAAAKVDRCCIVASLLSSEPKDQADQPGQEDRLGPVRHLPASAGGGRAAGGKGRRGRGAAPPVVRPQVRQQARQLAAARDRGAQGHRRAG